MTTTGWLETHTRKHEYRCNKPYPVSTHNLSRVARRKSDHDINTTRTPHAETILRLLRASRAEIVQSPITCYRAIARASSNHTSSFRVSSLKVGGGWVSGNVATASNTFFIPIGSPRSETSPAFDSLAAPTVTKSSVVSRTIL